MATVCLIATVKNEGPWLLEWIAHNRAIGFDRMVVASNDCTDGTDAMLDRLQDLGVLRHIRNAPPYSFRSNIQIAAYQRARRFPEVATADWIMPLDADEFLNIKLGNGRLADLLATVDDGVDVVPVVWRVFGDGGLDGWVDPPITDRLTRAGAAATNVNCVKMLMRNHHRFEMISAHGPNPLGAPDNPSRFPVNMSDPSGKPFGARRLLCGDKWFVSVPVERQCWDVAQVNHYMVRTRALYELKRLRGGPFERDPEAGGTEVSHRYRDQNFKRHNLNEEEDTSLSLTRPVRMAELERLMADPQLARLHGRAVEITKALLDHQTDGPKPPGAGRSGGRWTRAMSRLRGRTA